MTTPLPLPAADVQQVIQGFSPNAGKAGTVVTLTGRGFTGTRLASVGIANNVAVTVVSDSEARLVVPAGATSGVIGLFNATYSAYSVNGFTLRGRGR